MRDPIIPTMMTYHGIQNRDDRGNNLFNNVHPLPSPHDSKTVPHLLASISMELINE